jgi:hypothetical protein
MRLISGLLFVCGLVLVASFTMAQPPDGGKGGKGAKGDKGGPGGPGGGKTATVEEMVARMMTFDKNMDGKLTKDEVTDSRLQSLFDRADANGDGILTKEELTAFFTKEQAALNAQGGGPGGGFGPPGGPGGGFGGPGGPGGGFGPPGGMPRPGQILPPFLADRLNLTDDQKKQLADLQKDVDTKLDKILTADQKKQLQEMRPGGGPGGFGRPGGGPGGPGGPDGPGGGGPGRPGGGNPPPPM